MGSPGASGMYPDQVKNESTRTPTSAASSKSPADYAMKPESAKQAYLANLSLQMMAMGVQSGVAQTQLKLAGQQAGIANSVWQTYMNTFLPATQQWAKAAMAGVPPDYYAARAGADVGMEFQKAKTTQQQNMERLGVDPSSPRALAANENLAASEAAATAGAETRARQAAVNESYRRLGDVARFGKSMPMESANILSHAESGLTAGSRTFGLGTAGVSSAYGQLGQYYESRKRQQAYMKAARIQALAGTGGRIIGLGVMKRFLHNRSHMDPGGGTSGNTASNAGAWL